MHGLEIAIKRYLYGLFGGLGTVNSEMFARVLFHETTQHMRSFVKIKPFRNNEFYLSFTDYR